MNYGSSSPAFTITIELLKLKSGMPGVMIPYKSSNEMILSVIKGNRDDHRRWPPTMPQVKAGKVKALAVTGAERSALLPDVPSMAEAGFPRGRRAFVERRVCARGDAAGDRRQARKGARQAIRDPGVADKLKALAVDPGGATPEQFKAIIASDIVKFGDVVKAANLHFEE